MIFDLFHSVGDPVVGGASLGARRCLAQFLSQVQLAEALGMRVVWCAESHFSSEAQKSAARPAIPNYAGEVGLNADSFQLFHWLAANTQHIGLGTAIHNIVGGSGGPIASADRVNMLRFMNEVCWPMPRELHIGVASGRFPYQNLPFGISPRTPNERSLWPHVERIAFYEALEIFLRLLAGQRLGSDELERHEVTRQQALARGAPSEAELRDIEFPYRPERRWVFEALQLVPASSPAASERLHVVLGSADPRALEVARRHHARVDLFNLSFTPPERIEQLHVELAARDPSWTRERLPRTVLVFADASRAQARARAEAALDTYIEAMRGTAQVPDKSVLMERALIGDAVELREQLAPGGRHGFRDGDRLMLWFEFNQLDGAAIEAQMRYFFEQIASRL